MTDQTDMMAQALLNDPSQQQQQQQMLGGIQGMGQNPLQPQLGGYAHPPAPGDPAAPGLGQSPSPEKGLMNPFGGALGPLGGGLLGKLLQSGGGAGAGVGGMGILDMLKAQQPAAQPPAVPGAQVPGAQTLPY